MSDYDPLTQTFIPMRVACRRRRPGEVIDTDSDDSFLNLPEPVYESGPSLAEAIEHLAVETQARELPARRDIDLFDDDEKEGGDIEQH